jgi:hypothetical protein
MYILFIGIKYAARAAARVSVAHNHTAYLIPINCGSSICCTQSHSIFNSNKQYVCCTRSLNMRCSMSGLVELAQQLAQSVGSLSSRFMCSLLSFALFSRVSVICFYICCFFVFGSSICCTMRGLIKLAVHVLSSLCFMCSLLSASFAHCVLRITL